MAEKKKITKGLFNWTFLGIVVIGLILINIISSFLYTRIDMTEDQRYSLTKGTIEFLENKEQFQNRISIKIYLEGTLPAEIKHFRDEIEAKLVEFKQIAGDRIEFQFLDPNVGTEGEQQALFETLYAKGKGIMPLEIVYMKDGTQSKMMLWPGAVIDYGGTTVQTIQFLPGTPVEHPYVLDELTDLIDNSTKNLEYILVSSLRKTTQVKKPRVAFLQGHGELNFQQTQRVRSLIAPYFAIADITLNDSLAALDNVDGLIIARPTKKFSDKDLFIIDQFVMKGGRLMCFIDALSLNEDTLNRNGSTHTMRYETGIERMLFDYGLKLNDNYVVDVSCVDKPVPLGKLSKIPWFFHVLATPTKHPISRNLEPVSLKYTSQVDSISGETYKFSTVLTSSTNSSVTGLAPMVSLGMPLNYGENPTLVPDPSDENNKVILAGLTEGMYESHFKNRIVDEYSNNPAAKFLVKSSKEGKVLLIGNGRFIANSYDSMPARNGQGYMYRPTQFNDLRMDLEMASVNIPVYFGNQEFFQNLVDYMLGDNSVLDIRSRQIDIHAIDKEKVKADATFYKIINLLIPVLVVLLFALLMGYISKRKYVQK